MVSEYKTTNVEISTFFYFSYKSVTFLSMYIHILYNQAFYPLTFHPSLIILLQNSHQNYKIKPPPQKVKTLKNFHTHMQSSPSKKLIFNVITLYNPLDVFLILNL